MKAKKIAISAFIFAMALVMIPSTGAQAKKKPALSKKKATLTVGQTLKLKVKNNKKKVKWSSTKKKVASVSQKGRVRAKKAGSAVIKAKIGKKTLKCKLTVKKKKSTVVQKVVAVAVSSIKMPNAYTVQVGLSSAQALTANDFVVKTKKYSEGSYNHTLKLVGVASSGDKKTYTLSLDQETPLEENYHVQITVKNLKGTGTVNRYAVYSEGVFHYQDTLIYTAAQGSKVSRSQTVYGAGYSTCSVSGLPAGISYKVRNDDGEYIQFSGTPTKAGSFSGKIVTKDELGNTRSYDMIWLVGSNTSMVAAAEPAYDVVGGSDDDPYIRSPLYAAGGSGSYTYSFEGNSYGLKLGEDGIVYGDMDVTGAGTYTVTVLVKDKNNANLSARAKLMIYLKAGRTVSGIIKDAKGNAIQKRDAYVYFKIKNKADRYFVSSTCYADSKGTYSALLPDGAYEAYAAIGAGKGRIQAVQVSGNRSGLDFSIPVYPLTIRSGDAGISANDFGDWYDADDKQYGTGSKLWLPAGTHRLSCTGRSGTDEYTAVIRVTVNTSSAGSTTATVTKKSLIRGALTTAQPVSLALTKQYQFYTFIPEKTGTYRFYSGGSSPSSLDTYGMLESNGYNLDSDDDSAGNGHFKIEHECTAGQTYYVGIHGYSSGEGKAVSLYAEYVGTEG